MGRLQQSNLVCIPHAGEQLNSEIIWETINILKPYRIGHGIKAIEDLELIKYLEKYQIPLDVCPSSNIVLGFYPTLHEHPIKKLVNYNLNLSINSDDP